MDIITQCTIDEAPPEDGTRYWSILAPGPSLVSWSTENKVNRFLPTGPVIAVNNAALSGLPHDFICAIDSPKGFSKLHQTVSSEDKLKMVVLCRNGTADAWRNMGYKVWPHAHLEKDFIAMHWPRNRHPPDARFGAYSVTTAMLRAVGAGAEALHIYGMDMDGVGYSYGEDYRKRNARQWNSRWVSERPIIIKCFQSVVDAGVDIYRIMPK
jgi:hypothetical protein